MSLKAKLVKFLKWIDICVAMVKKSQLSTKLKSTSRMATRSRNQKSQGVQDH